MPSLWERLYGLATMPEEQAQGQVRGLLYNTAANVAGLPQRAFEASEERRAGGEYDPAPAVETALNVMGTGAIAGVPVKGAESVLGAGIIRPKPLIGGYHGTGSPTDFTEFQLPPKTHDLGIHSTIDPNVAAQYARNKPSFNTSLSHLTPEDLRIHAHARTVPILADVQNPLKVPFDAGKWNQAENVIQPLEDFVAKGGRYQLPRGLLEDMRNIGGSDQTWQNQFAPMLKDRGYDSVFYPHGTDYSNRPMGKYNTFMTFDPAQTVPRFSPQGQKLAAERGVHEPMKKDPAYDWDEGATKWNIPKGLLKKIDDPEPFGPVREAVEARKQKWQENYDKEFGINKSMQTFADLEKKFKNQEVTGEQFWKEYDKIFETKNVKPLEPVLKNKDKAHDDMAKKLAEDLKNMKINAGVPYTGAEHIPPKEPLYGAAKQQAEIDAMVAKAKKNKWGIK